MISKQIIRTMVVVFFTQLIVLGSAYSETWKIASLDWQPYSGSDLANQGNSVEKLKKLLKSEGIDLVVEFFPWLRAQKNATTKDYIGYFPAWPEEVKEGFVASPAVDYSYLGVLSNKESGVKWDNIDSVFSHNKIGVVQTYVYPKDIDAAIKKYPKNIDFSPDEVALVKKISIKRITVAITDPKVMLYNAEKLGLKNIVVINNSIEKKDLVIALRNDEENKKRIELIKHIIGKSAKAK